MKRQTLALASLLLLALGSRADASALLRARSKQLFDWIVAGELKVKIGAVYRLAEAAQAHADIESRGTAGKLLMIP